MNKPSKNLSVFVDVLRASEDGSLPSEIQVLPIGRWATKKYGALAIQEEDVDKICENFADNVRAGVPIDVDHDGKAAAGWIKSLINRGSEGLWASVEWTKLGREMLQDKIYRFFSPEFSFNYEDPEFSTEHGPVLVAGTLTNRPLFKELQPLVANDGTAEIYTAKEKASKIEGNTILFIQDSPMPSAKPAAVKADEVKEVKKADDETSMLAELLAKPLEELTEEEMAWLAEHLEMMSADDSKKYADFLKAQVEAYEKVHGSLDEATEEPAVEAKEVKAEEPVVEKAEVKEAVKADEKSIEVVDKSEAGMVSIKASELEAKDKRILAAEAELKKVAIEREVDKTYMLSEAGGRVAPAGRSALVNLMLTFSDAQRKMFDEVMQAVPGKKIFGEIGSAKAETLNTGDQLSKIMNEKILASEKTGKKLDATSAFVEAYKELHKK